MKTYKGFKVLTLTDKGLLSPIARKTYKHLGDWTKEIATTRMCSKGWHLWDNRASADQMFKDYAGAGRTVLLFAAEGQGLGGRRGMTAKKSVYKTVRLTKLLKVHLPWEARKALFEQISAELDRAYLKHGAEPWGRHEFYAILKEEVDELWDAIKQDKSQSDVLGELVQVAAMCFRYAETGDRYGRGLPEYAR